MTELERILVERIRRQGPMPFAAYMRYALYDPTHGYYARGARTGFHGDFVTSPEIDPAFGALWARAFAETWRASGEPAAFTIVEVGPGEGGFARAVLDHLPARLTGAITYVLVERMPEARDRQAGKLTEHQEVRWVPSVVDLQPFDAGVVFANEVLDNAPVHLVETRGGRVLEVVVTLDGERLVEDLVEPSNPELLAYLARCGVELAEGARMEIGLAAESMARRLADVVGRGAVVFVDYGAEAAELANHAVGTLVTYSRAGAGDDPLAEPGERDITSHANWTAVRAALQERSMEVAGPVPQGAVLKALGIAEIDATLRAEHDAALEGGRGADAVAALSRRHAVRALLEPSGMGGFGVVSGARGVVVPPALTGPAGD